MTNSNVRSKIRVNIYHLLLRPNQYIKASGFGYLFTFCGLRAVKYTKRFVFSLWTTITTSMTTRTQRRNAYTRPAASGWRVRFNHYFQAWGILLLLLALLAPQTFTLMLGHVGEAVSVVPRLFRNLIWSPPVGIAPLFTDQVDYWAADITRWAKEHELDPNLLATVMQIESCGHPNVASHAGAQGLFQVMPFHFETGENQLDPETNASRGADFLRQCVGWANGDAGLAMACYNGGPSVISRPVYNWPEETRRYYQWGTGIYADAIENDTYSQTLNQWLAAGGVYLCDRAGKELGLN